MVERDRCAALDRYAGHLKNAERKWSLSLKRSSPAVLWYSTVSTLSPHGKSNICKCKLACDFKQTIRSSRFVAKVWNRRSDTDFLHGNAFTVELKILLSGVKDGLLSAAGSRSKLSFMCRVMWSDEWVFWETMRGGVRAAFAEGAGLCSAPAPAPLRYSATLAIEDSARNWLQKNTFLTVLFMPHET